MTFPKNMLRRIPPLSVRVYMALFLLFTGVAFVLLGIAVLDKMDVVKSLVEQQYDDAARRELERAIKATLEDATRASTTLAEWDETHQQLAEPVYYAYWRDQRLNEAKHLPPYIVAVELYDAQRRALAPQTSGGMPRTAAAGDTLVRDERGLWLYRLAPVASRRSTRATAGFVLLKIDFLQALLTINRLQSIDPESVVLRPAVTGPVAADGILDTLVFARHSNPLPTKLENVLYGALLQAALLIVFLVAVSYGLVAMLFSTPLRRLVEHIGALRDGKTTALSATGRAVLPLAELERLRCSLNEYQGQLDEAHARLNRHNQELQRQARVDPLTGVFNRRAFDEDWDKLLEIAGDRRARIAFLQFDCDRFKAINDAYGHAIGDRVIQAIATSLQQVLRRGDKLYRLGGDEFAAFLWDAGENEAGLVANRCAAAIRRYAFEDLGVREPVYVSVGIACSNGNEPTELRELPRRADVAMYRAKHAGHGNIVHYDAGTAVEAPRPRDHGAQR